MSLLYRIMYILFKWPVKWICRIHVHGKKNEPSAKDGPVVICANHLSNLDPLILCDVLRHRQPYYMTKAELFGFPPLRWFLKAFGAFPIHRGGADLGALKNALDLLSKGRSVAVFPQGHRNPGVDPASTRIMSGAGWIADHASVPCLPVLIKYKDWKPGFFKRIDVYIGKPVMPSEWADYPEGYERSRLISETVMRRICEADRETVK